MLGFLIPDEVRRSFMRQRLTARQKLIAGCGWSLVRVPGDELRDSEGEPDLETHEERKAGHDQHHEVPRHSLSGLALGREPCLLGPLLGAMQQAV